MCVLFHCSKYLPRPKLNSIFIKQCLQLIADKFPNSPRVDCLIGIRMEATEPPETALKYYADILEADSANVVRTFIYASFVRLPSL